MNRDLIHREVRIGGKEGEITNILGCGYEVTFFNVRDGKTYIDAKDIERYLVKKTCTENTEHPVWSILHKGKYDEKFFKQAEEMYDFIRRVVNVCGSVTKDGNTVPTMKVFHNMWDEYPSETFNILKNLVDDKEQK